MGVVDIRTARSVDYAAIVAVMDDWWGRPVRSILPRLFLDHFWHTSFVAEDQCGLAGFLVGFLSPAHSDTAYVHALAVAPRCRRMALAATLHERFAELARAEGRSVVKAITSEGNTGSIRFHTRIGFAVSESIPDYDGPGCPRVVFTKTLH